MWYNTRLDSDVIEIEHQTEMNCTRINSAHVIVEIIAGW